MTSEKVHFKERDTMDFKAKEFQITGTYLGVSINNLG